MKLLAIIPAYNEEECLAATVNNLVAACPDIDYVIINDGSVDRTKDICEEEAFNFVSLPINCGLASGFQTGCKYALENSYDAVVQFDADGQHLPQSILTMQEAMEREGADIVIGSRILAGEHPEGMRNLGSKLIGSLISLTSNTTITDPTSGLRMYSKPMVEQFAKGFDLSPEPDAVALLARRGAKVIEVPVTMQDRQGGESYLTTGASVSYMARTCLSILLFQWFR